MFGFSNITSQYNIHYTESYRVFHASSGASTCDSLSMEPGRRPQFRFRTFSAGVLCCKTAGVLSLTKLSSAYDAKIRLLTVGDGKEEGERATSTQITTIPSRAQLSVARR